MLRKAHRVQPRKETQKIGEGQFSSRLPHGIQRKAKQRLDAVHAADTLEDLRLPPSNWLVVRFTKTLSFRPKGEILSTLSLYRFLPSVEMTEFCKCFTETHYQECSGQVFLATAL